MPRTTIPSDQIRELGVQDLTVAAGELLIPFDVSDNVNGDQTPSTGKELLAIMNTDVAPGTVTIDGAPDTYGRDGAITAYILAAGAVAITGVLPQQAFSQNGMININTSASTMHLAVLRVP